jgi:hypothetical protein
MDHLNVPFSVTIMLPATPFTLREIFVVGPTKSSLLVVIHEEQQLSIMRGTLSESKGAETGPAALVLAARPRFCWLAIIAKAKRLSLLGEDTLRLGELACLIPERWFFRD